MAGKGSLFAARLILAAALSVNLPALSADAQVIVPFEPGNRLTAAVAATVTFDSASGLYVYTYELSNDPNSLQNIWYFALEFPGASQIRDVTSPRGWSFGRHIDRPIIGWAATEVGPLPPGYVDDGNVVGSPFQIVPGAALGGFSFRSPDPPAAARFFAEGFTKLPQVTSDVGELPGGSDTVLDLPENSFNGSTTAPRPVAGTVFPGGRRPAVDGFLVFAGIASGDTRAAPVAIIINFSEHGETVDRSTFRATLNDLDVTAAFLPGGTSGDLVAVFDLGRSPLRVGRNVLITTVDGLVPDTARTATDVDRLTFVIQ